MRILLVSQYFWPENFRINDVAKTLLDKGIGVEVLTGKPNYPRGEFFPGYHLWGFQHDTYQGLQVSRIPLLKRGRGGWRLAVNYLSFVVSGVLFTPWLMRGKKFDAVFVYAPSPILQAIPAIFLGWLTNVPVVLWVQDLWPESLSATGQVRNRFIIKAVGQLVRFIYRHVDLLLVQSKAFIAPVSLLASGTPVKYFPNSVDGNFALPYTGELPCIPGLDAGFSVLFAGNIGTAQAVEVIVDAAAKLAGHEEIQFIVLGDGSRKAWMLREISHLGLRNLHLPGSFPIEMMPGFMQKASSLLVTLADQEIFRATIPSKVQAYLAAGRPIIACLNGEGADLVTEAKAGLAVAAEDGQALADTVLHLYRMSPAARAEMGKCGRSYYENHFAHEPLVDELIDHIKSVCVD